MRRFEAEGDGAAVHRLRGWRGPHDLVLVSIHDDATSRMQFGRFVKRDTGAENRRAIIACLKRHGRPLAVHADHAGQLRPTDEGRPAPAGTTAGATPGQG